MDSPYAINTASGAQLDLADPDPAVICLEDIAAALSKVCRFGAQTTRFYSVAQHAVLVQRLVVGAGRPELALAALHHDSHEAFVGDVTTPLKRMLGPEFVASESAEEVSWQLGHRNSVVTRAVYVHELKTAERTARRRQRMEAESAGFLPGQRG